MGGNVQFMKMIFFQHVCVANKKKQGCVFLGIPECFIFVI